MKLKFWSRDSGEDLSRDSEDKPLTSEDTVPDDGTPWWVNLFTDWGRPVAAIVVLVLCAPGEQHLAKLAGWNGSYEWLSWGMAGLFSMYAGISAIVATKRSKDAPGKRSAVWGAVVSLMLAMAAQPVSHMFVTGWWTADPRAPWQLVVVVSCIPPFILGHLLHLASSPAASRTKDKDSSVPVFVSEDNGQTYVSRTERLLSEGQDVTIRQGRTHGDSLSRPEVPVSRPVLDTADKATEPVPSVPEKDRERVPAPRAIDPSKPSMTAVAFDVLRDNPYASDNEIKTVLLNKFGQDSKSNSVAKAIKRARERSAA